MDDMVMVGELKRFAGRRVFITGHTGFKGAWLAFWLRRLGAEVMGFALPAEHEECLFRVLDLGRLLHHVEGDVRSISQLQKAISTFQPEFVFHLAAQALVGRSYDDPLGTLETNVMGTANVLECVRWCANTKAVLCITSDKCYRNQEWEWGYRENDELGGHDPYSASKAAAEIVCAAFRDSYFGGDNAPGIATARAGNVIGGGDWSEDRLIPDCIRALIRGEAVELRRPEACRPWQHVLDPLRGYMMLALALEGDPQLHSEAWNFGPLPGAALTVGEVAARAGRMWGRCDASFATVQPRYHETRILRLCADKAMSRLGWRPVWGVQRTLAETLAWYKNWHEQQDMRSFTSSQIDTYMEEGGS